MAAEAEADHPPPISDAQFEATAKAIRAEALSVFDDPRLRKLLIELKTQSEVTIDHFSRDVVIGAAFDEKAATEMTGRFRRFLEENRTS